jgi:transcriptional regulator with XRE-family HTH domain
MELDYSVIFERMLKAGNLKNSSEMARMLGLTPQAMSSYKRKGELSAGLIFKFAGICGVSIDWLLSGKGEIFRSDREARPVQEVCSIALVERVTRGRGGGGSRAKGGKWGQETVREGPAPDPVDTALLNPDELIYTGKLLKILRGSEKAASPALKANIDAFFLSAFPSEPSS